MGIMQISLINELRFVPEGYETLEQYNYAQFDREWARYQLLPFQRKDIYQYRKQQNDKNCIQINTDHGDIELEIREAGTNIILDTISYTSDAAVAGNEYEGIPLHTYQWIFRLKDILPSFTGTCYYVIKGTSDSATKYYVSEPIWVKEKWPGSVLLNWRHNRNEYDIIFSLNPDFSCRVDGYMVLEETDSTDTQFNDQNNVTVTLNSIARRKFRLEIGGYRGVPRYLLDRLVNFFRCKSIRVEGWKYTKDDGAKLEFDKSNTNTLFNASILLQEANPVDSYTFKTNNVLNILPASGFPYMVQIMGLVTPDGTEYFVNVPNPIVIENLGSAQSFVDLWNSQTLAKGLNGEFRIQNGYIVYLADYYENFNPVSTALYKVFTESVRLTTVNASATRTISNSGEIGIDWAGTLVVKSVGASSVSHNFGNSGVASANVRYFHNDEIESFKADTPFKTALSLAFSGVMSSALLEFVLDGIHSSATILNLELLKYCNLTLQKMVCVNSSVQTIVDPFTFNASDPNNFWVLADVQFNNNSITQSGMQTFIVGLRNNTNFSYNAGSLGKTLIMNNQTPAVTPNIPTQNAIIDLVAAGWSVNV